MSLVLLNESCMLVPTAFDPPAILFIPKATTLKTDNVQEFNLCNGQRCTGVGKTVSYSNKNKPIETAKSKFDLVETMLEDNALMHWQEFRCIKIVQIPKNPDRTGGVAPGICIETYKVCLGLLKKHYFPQNAARLQNNYLCNHIKKPNKLL
eukprot:5795735-Ditylum_brightwellii.AAC.1